MSESSPDPVSETATPDAELLAALADDFGARLRRHEHPTIEEYAARYPALADRIRNVLAAVAMMEHGLPDATLLSGGPGSTIGRYKLRERIGEGGFGVVYMAEQQHPVRRRVALKVIKPGMDSRQVLARFEAERQALAIMDHPNIAKVLDAGATESGRPYFVMELVKGEPITEYCDQHQLEPRERLQLFVQVCQAVQHAHQKGIIHRDIKPSNVLVSVHDTKPVVKVIDFGVAKALGQELTESTLFTGFAQLLGTPLYMSPEQAGHSALDVDTRSDIYSLGVLLYELLTGTTPFDKERFRRAAEDEIRRIIREEEPPRPSTRLSASKDSLASVSAQRRTEPAQLTKLVRGELDWIVMKALEKDRTRRYETANGLARDIERHLRDEPVEACPPSTSYKLRKFVRRNKATLLTALMIGLALLLAVGSLGWALRDRTARQAKVAVQVELILTEVEQLEREQKWPEALIAARRAGAVATSGADAATTRRVREMLKDLEFIDRLERIQMETVWVERELDRTGAARAYGEAFRDYGIDVEKLDVETSVKRLKARPTIAIPIAASLDYWASAPRAGWERLRAIARGIDPEPLRDKLRATDFGGSDGTSGDELSQLAESVDIRAQPPQTLYGLANALERLKRSEAALRLLRAAQAEHPDDFWINYNLASFLVKREDHDGAVRFYTSAVSIRPRATGALNNLGAVLHYQKKLDEAVAVLRKAIAIDPRFATARLTLGDVLQDQRKPDEAIASYRKAIEIDPASHSAYCSLGKLLSAQEKGDEAVAAWRKAIETDPACQSAYGNLGNVLRKQGKMDEAIAAYRKAIELDPKFVPAYDHLAFALVAQKKTDEAITVLRRAIEFDPNNAGIYNSLGLVLCNHKKDYAAGTESFRKVIELDPKNAMAHNNLGVVLRDQKKHDEAIASFRKAIEVDPNYVEAYVNLGWSLKTPEGLSALEKAVEIDPEHAGAVENLAYRLTIIPDTQSHDPARTVVLAKKAAEWNPNARTLQTLGWALYRSGDWPGTIAAMEKSIELQKAGDPWQWFALALAHQKLGHEGEAREYYALAVERMEKTKSKDTIYGFRPEAEKVFGVNDPEKTIAAFRKEIEVNASDVRARVRLGNALRRQGRLDEAAAEYREAFRLEPQSADARKEWVSALNGWAWTLATDAVSQKRDPARAITLAKEALELDPKLADGWNTLGVAQYRAGNWTEAIGALEKYRELRTGDAEWSNPFLLAMAHWQLGRKDEARRWYGIAAEWMDKNAPRSETLTRFRAEAVDLLGVDPKSPQGPSTAPATSKSQSPQK